VFFSLLKNIFLFIPFAVGWNKKGIDKMKCPECGMKTCKMCSDLGVSWEDAIYIGYVGKVDEEGYLHFPQMLKWEMNIQEGNKFNLYAKDNQLILRMFR
jgi:hypothetical protein